MGNNRREGFETDILSDDDLFAGVEGLESAGPRATLPPLYVCDACGMTEGQCIHFGGTDYKVILKEEYGVDGKTEVAVETVQDQPTTDKDGYPWDKRIHGAAKNINKDGTWRLIRGVDKDLVAKIRGEATTISTIATEQMTANVDQLDPWVCADCGGDGNSCDHNKVCRASEYREAMLTLSQEGEEEIVARCNELVEGRLRSAVAAISAGPTQAPPTNGVTAEMVITKFVETRDLIAKKKKAHEEEIEDLKDLQEKRENWLNGELIRLNLESFKTSAGTCFVDWKDSATVADNAKFMDWVHEGWEKNKHFLENRVSKSAVKQRLEDGELTPPGITYTKVRSVKIRRA